ncbi:addiction module protein [Thalassolituus sp.]|jgi:putative addiction module component (TIGR02574 family)|uniref:addiction module protein n=1 Tax=Thalassolituus sp. TaxID=2030822 RepID=UPI0032D97934
MDLRKIENEALHLSHKERVELIRSLVLSIDSPSEDELKEEWLLEAQRRTVELDNKTVQAVSAEDVLAKTRRLIR